MCRFWIPCVSPESDESSPIMVCGAAVEDDVVDEDEDLLETWLDESILCWPWVSRVGASRDVWRLMETLRLTLTAG